MGDQIGPTAARGGPVPDDAALRGANVDALVWRAGRLSKAAAARAQGTLGEACRQGDPPRLLAWAMDCPFRAKRRAARNYPIIYRVSFDDGTGFLEVGSISRQQRHTGHQDIYWRWGVDTFPLAKGNPDGEVWSSRGRHSGVSRCLPEVGERS